MRDRSASRICATRAARAQAPINCLNDTYCLTLAVVLTMGRDGELDKWMGARARPVSRAATSIAERARLTHQFAELLNAGLDPCG